MNKCEWRDDTLYDCKTRHKHKIRYWDGVYFSFCPFCGADIRKPEPSVIIKKSGGTWVARYDGVDWLWMKQGMELVPKFKEKNWDWVPIESLTITDDIAKLRPMVVHELEDFAKKIYRLYGVDETAFPVICFDAKSDELDGFKLSECRLATVTDL